MRDLEILSHLSYDHWMLVIAWLMMLFVVWYVATKQWNDHHREWVRSNRIWAADDEIADL